MFKVELFTTIDNSKLMYMKIVKNHISYMKKNSKVIVKTSTDIFKHFPLALINSSI